MSSSSGELDKELLQLAGRRGGGSNAKRKRSRKVESESDEDVSLEEESDWEEEEEEYAVSAKRSRQVGRPRAAAPEEEGLGGKIEINEEDLIADEQDRQRLAAMTELEREMELAERAEARQQEMQRAQLLRAAEQPAKEKPKRRGRPSALEDADAELPAAARRSGREAREEAAKKSAMDELKAARQRKARGERAAPLEEAGEEEAAGEAALSGAASMYARQAAELDASDGEAEEGETGARGWAAGRRRGYESDEEGGEEASLEEVKGIQVRRHRLEEWFTQPFFEATLPGCMVRVLAGNRRTQDGQVVMENGQPQQRYILAQVVDVEERPAGLHKYGNDLPAWKTPYPFGQQGAGKPRTFKWIRVAAGHSERYWPLAQVSNSSFTEAEFQRWHDTCAAGGRPQLTCGEVTEVRGRLVKAENYTYTAEDVAKLLEEKRARGSAPRNAAMEQARLERQRDAATEAGDAEGAVAAQAAIEELKAAAAATVARRGGGVSMAELNRKNEDLNFQASFKSSAGAGGAGGDGGDATAAGLDPFSRRATRPMIYWNTKKKAAGEQAAEEEEQPAEGGAGGEDVLSPRAAVAVVVEEVVDLSGLDLSALELPPRVPALARRLLGAAAGGEVATLPPGARVWTLQEYKQRHQGVV